MLMHDPPHPGQVIKRQCLGPLRLTVTAAAKGFGVLRNTLSTLLNGRLGISPEVAIRLSQGFGGSPGELVAAADAVRLVARAATPGQDQGEEIRGRIVTLCR